MTRARCEYVADDSALERWRCAKPAVAGSSYCKFHNPSRGGVRTTTCSRCNGTGRVWLDYNCDVDWRCETCDGRGSVLLLRKKREAGR